jgi:LacI family transcriptional regulator
MMTQKDVARRAGVSTATVSRLINQKGYISPAIKEKINSAIQELGYKPNLVARSLKIRSSRTIGLIFPDIENPFFITVIKKAEEVAQQQLYNVILCNTENRPEKEIEYLEVLKGKQVDGYIIIPSLTTGSSLMPMLEGERVVFLDRRIDKERGHVVLTLNNRNGVKMAIDHLARLGHSRIAAVCVPTNVTTGMERLQGYRKALEDNGIPFDESLVRYADFSVQSAFEKTTELLSTSVRPTALFPMSGPTTLGALRAIKELGVRVPEELSVIGFDEFEYADLLRPALSVIAQPAAQFGSRGIELLLKLLRGGHIHRRSLVLDPVFIERESCRRIP